MCWRLLRKLRLVLVEERPRIVVLRLKIMKFLSADSTCQAQNGWYQVVISRVEVR
jgi:hypothetical protein